MSEASCLFQSYNFPTHFIGLDENASFEVKIVTGKGDKFRLVSPGLTGQEGTVSFESEIHPGHYLRHADYFLHLRKFEANGAYSKDATFWRKENAFGYEGFDAYESINFPKHFIRHQNYRLKISLNDNSDVFKKDACFKKIPPPVRRGNPMIFESCNFPKFQWGFNDDGLPVIAPQKPHQAFRIVTPGLTGESGTVSFESETFPGYYLRHYNSDLHLHPFKEESLYRKDASFAPTSLLPGFVAYRSQNYPEYYIRHQNYRLKISNYSGNISELMRKDASFKLLPASPLKFSVHPLISKNYPEYRAGTNIDGAPMIVRNINDPQYILLSPGLNGVAGTYSIVDRRHPSHYLRCKLPLRDERLYYAEFSELQSEQEKDAATFVKLENYFSEGYASFANYSRNDQGGRRFIRHSDYYLMSSTYSDQPTQIEINDACFSLEYKCAK